MTGHTAPISAAARVHADPGELLVTGARDRTAKFWHPGSGRCVESLILPSPVQCLAAGDDGSVLVGADWEVMVFGQQVESAQARS
jgi:hypothetical protein